jgi:hypothetical protein
MNEMIWAFEQKQPDCNWEQKFYSGKHDVKHVPCRWDVDGKVLAYESLKGPNDTFQVDREGMKKHQDRIDNGLRLFGKYYQGLWD